LSNIDETDSNEDNFEFNNVLSGTFSCIGNLYGGLHECPINTEIPGMTLLFEE
jgi:hypothetical protein